jgi:hypothetical protein
MATVEAADRTRVNAPAGVTRITSDETKPSLRTTEFFAMIGAIGVILIAAAIADNFDAPQAWTLVAVVATGYMVSRGLAKSGSRHTEDNAR